MGSNVLLLEAGRKLDLNAELKSMEWPYDHPRRGAMSPKYHALSLNEYNIRTPPYANGPASRKGLLVRPGMERLGLQQEHRRQREAASVHRHQLRVGPRAVSRRQDEHLGAARAADGGSRLQGASHDGYGEDWPIGYGDVAPYYDRVDRLLGISGIAEETCRICPTSIFQRPFKLNAPEVHLRKTLQRWDGSRRPIVPASRRTGCSTTSTGASATAAAPAAAARAAATSTRPSTRQPG